MYLSLEAAVKLVTDMLGEEFIRNSKIQAIKLVRQLTNQGLKESKDAIEAEINRLAGALEYQTPVSTKDNRVKALRSMRDAIDTMLSVEVLQRNEYAPEPADGSVIMFTHQFSAAGGVYTYVATRAGGAWFITGQAGAWIWADLQAKYRALRTPETFQYLG